MIRSRGLDFSIDVDWRKGWRLSATAHINERSLLLLAPWQWRKEVWKECACFRDLVDLMDLQS
jgi:hypothetical protein